jgi:2-polyprenyl-3-methyl-5-hydroxy-6-metoxy-1,4-benzoquinol methylase
VVWHALREVLETRYADRPAAVVDIGGGTGGLAVRVAGLGHQVVVVDPSPDALATLARRADESGVADRVTGRQGDLATVSDLVPDGSVDLVLCHGVLEIVEDPAAALAALAGILRPGGTLSLLVNQRHAAVVTRAMAGHFTAARALLADGSPDGSPDGAAGTGRRFTADELTAVLDTAGLDTEALQGVRVFVDLVPSSLVDLEPGAAEALVELEQAVATRPEYLTLATQIHAVATRR